MVAISTPSSRLATVLSCVTIVRLACLLAVLLATLPAMASVQVLEGALRLDDGVHRAGEGGARLALGGDTRMDLAPRSRFQVEATMRLAMLSERVPARRKTLTFRLLEGEAEIRVPRKSGAGPAVLLRGPRDRVSTVTREGSSVFSVSREVVSVVARDATLLVGVGGRWAPLAAGHARSWSPGRSTGQVRPLVAAPVGLRVPGVVLSGLRPSVRIPLSWRSVPGAARYAVSVEGRAASGEQVRLSLETSALAAGLDLPPIGRYRVRLAAVDRFGIAGSWSRSRMLRVVGVELPEGAWVNDAGAAVLGPRQLLGLTGAEGLELTYGYSRHFVRAPTAVGLGRGLATVVRLRVPGHRDATRLMLEARALQAEVDVGPKVATWPRDSVVARVQLIDRLGREVPRDFVPSLEVSVNLRPVNVRWERSAGAWRAIVPRPETPGPWIVRVEAFDGRGVSLGRGFLEVARSRAERRALSMR